MSKGMFAFALSVAVAIAAGATAVATWTSGEPVSSALAGTLFALIAVDAVLHASELGRKDRTDDGDS